jgi:hypothetical protein
LAAGIVADFLSRYLGQYIDGFDPKQLKIGIWNGKYSAQTRGA